jgi:hypothetical protein
LPEDLNICFPKIPTGYILEGLDMENVGTDNGQLVYFLTIRYILWPIGIFYGHLVYFMANWYILWSLGQNFPILVCCTKQNLATLAMPLNFSELINLSNLKHFQGMRRLFENLFES